jgi:hypothetical protein
MALLGEFKNRCDVAACLLDRRREAEYDGQVHDTGRPLVWTPRTPPELFGKRERYIWARVNLVVALAEAQGIQVTGPLWLRYLDSHLPAIRQIDAGDPNWTLPRPVKISTSHLTLHRGHLLKNEDRMILDRLEAQYPTLCWRIEDVSPVTILDKCNPYNVTKLDGYTKYWACMHVIANCIEVRSFDAYQYLACFTDLFASVTDDDPNDDILDLVRFYPYDNRAFTPYDMPDPTALLIHIPLWGEKLPAPSKLIHVIQKSLPFAFQRRKIVHVVQGLLRRSESFFRLFARLLWCMYAQLYPNQDDESRQFDIKRLVAIQRACYSREKLTSWFSTDKAGSVVTTVIKLWVTLIRPPASKRVDWDAVAAASYEQAHYLVANTDFAREQPFEQPDFKPGPMYRYREMSMVQCLIKQLQSTSLLLSSETKSRVLNLLIRVRPELRLDPLTISAIGISETSVQALVNACRVYLDSGLPRALDHELAKIVAADRPAVYWFLHVVSLLDRIVVVPLPTAIADQIDRATLRHKYSSTYEGQYVNPNVFTVYVSLCCNSIHTLSGQGGYGHIDMVWSITTGQITCSRSNKIQTELSIPCTDTPVLGIPLRGCLLLWHETAYLHCPKCGDFHEYCPLNWCGEAGYACNRCFEQLTRAAICTVCGIMLTPKAQSKYRLRTEDTENATINWMYYCKRHYDAITRTTGLRPRHE